MRSCTRCLAAACVIAATLAGAATAAAQTFCMIKGRVKDSTGANVSDAEVTLYAVDEGILNLTGYETPEKGYEWFGKNPGHEALTAHAHLRAAATLVRRL